VRSGGDCEHHGGRGLGWCARVNDSASLIKGVSEDQRKRLTRLGQQAGGQVQVVLTPRTQRGRHRRRGETPPPQVLTGNGVNP